jgi:hypothetical protein
LIFGAIITTHNAAKKPSESNPVATPLSIPCIWADRDNPADRRNRERGGHRP